MTGKKVTSQAPEVALSARAVGVSYVTSSTGTPSLCASSVPKSTVTPRSRPLSLSLTAKSGEATLATTTPTRSFPVGLNSLIATAVLASWPKAHVATVIATRANHRYATVISASFLRRTSLKGPSPSVLRRTAKHAEPLPRLGGKLRGKLTRGELSAQCGSLSRIQRAEAGGALRFCFRAQRRERSPGQGEVWNASCERPQVARDAIHENTSRAPG